MVKLGGGWDEALAPLFESENYRKIHDFLKQEYSHHVVYPDMYDIFNCFKFTPYDIFNCFKFTPFDKVKVVLLGQDPYHNVGQAHGLCFSVQEGVDPPPSLVNIFKELRDDIGCEIPKSGNLTKWAKEGVLLLNTALTVRAHRANSHKDCGWTWFRQLAQGLRLDVVHRQRHQADKRQKRARLSDKKEHVVFILWGGNARSKKPLIDRSKHLILECAHPSPLSAFNGFFGCRHFSKTNAYLTAHGEAPIDWDLTK